ncbi:MAG: NAD-dependent DNA ligase LigA [Bacteroidales bacterium]|nr:NAD-dependent DNA ligase LigA [Bacteroidales bacterium]
MECIHEWEYGRSTLSFEVDGVVIKVNHYQYQQELGSTAKSPRWAIAYKYKPDRVSTILLSVDFQVGRTGAITPIANLMPVFLAGTTVKRASLHNADVIKALDIRLNDTVFVEKGGEIIPKIVGIELSERATDSKPFKFIETCPECNTPLQRKEGEAIFYCPNESDCPPQIKGRIEHFISKNAMDIDSLGEGKIEILYNSGLVKDPADLYDLKYEDLIGLEKIIPADESGKKEKKISFQEKTAQNILKGMEASKEATFDRILYALGIRHVGQTVASRLADYYLNINSLIETTFEQLILVDEIGEKIAESVTGYFSEPENILRIERLKSAGLRLEKDKNILILSDSLKGKTIVVTGKLENFSRDQIVEVITQHGGKATSSISKKTDLLLAGENVGPNKLKKAKELGIQIINESEFLKMIE